MPRRAVSLDGKLEAHADRNLLRPIVATKANDRDPWIPRQDGGNPKLNTTGLIERLVTNPVG